MAQKSIATDTVRIQILKILLEEPGGSPLTFSELKEETHRHDAVLARELKNLVDAGLILKDQDGYKINRDSKEYADVLKTLTLESRTENYHHFFNCGDDINVYISCEEINNGLITTEDISKRLFKETLTFFEGSIQDIISAKSVAVIQKELESGLMNKKLFENTEAYFKALKSKPCKIIITINIPVFDKI